MKLFENIKRAQGAHLANTRGMTLIEIMIVITIMASIMGVVGFYVVGALEDANKQEAKIQMGNLKSSLDMYYTRSSPNEYPESLDKLVDKRIMKEIPSDPWGEPYIYRRDSRTEYTLKSKGPDTAEGGGDDISPGDDGNSDE